MAIIRHVNASSLSLYRHLHSSTLHVGRGWQIASGKCRSEKYRNYNVWKAVKTESRKIPQVYAKTKRWLLMTVIVYRCIADVSAKHFIKVASWFNFITWLLFTARRYASAVYAVIVCLSVCLSVTRRSSTKTTRITITTPYDSPGTLVLWCQKSRRNSNEITPTGAPNRGGVCSNAIFYQGLNLRNGAR